MATKHQTDVPMAARRARRVEQGEFGIGGGWLICFQRKRIPGLIVGWRLRRAHRPRQLLRGSAAWILAILEPAASRDQSGWDPAGAGSVGARADPPFGPGVDPGWAVWIQSSRRSFEPRPAGDSRRRRSPQLRRWRGGGHGSPAFQIGVRSKGCGGSAATASSATTHRANIATTWEASAASRGWYAVFSHPATPIKNAAVLPKGDVSCRDIFQATSGVGVNARR